MCQSASNASNASIAHRVLAHLVLYAAVTFDCVRHAHTPRSTRCTPTGEKKVLTRANGVCGRRHPSSEVSGKKKTGFMSKKIGAKKESMFAVPEGGRVGVVGSGAGTTGFAAKKRNEFAK